MGGEGGEGGKTTKGAKGRLREHKRKRKVIEY
jgi:hypothetical protein